MAKAKLQLINAAINYSILTFEAKIGHSSLAAAKEPNWEGKKNNQTISYLVKCRRKNEKKLISFIAIVLCDGNTRLDGHKKRQRKHKGKYGNFHCSFFFSLSNTLGRAWGHLVVHVYFLLIPLIYEYGSVFDFVVYDELAIVEYFQEWRTCVRNLRKSVPPPFPPFRCPVSSIYREHIAS